MDAVKILNSVKKDVIDHLDNNFSLLMDEKAKLKADFTNADIRRLGYHFQVLTDTGFKEIHYVFEISVAEV